MRQIVLASASPRRRELLSELELDFIVRQAPDLKEKELLNEFLGKSSQPRSIQAIGSALERLAVRKGEAVAEACPEALVLSADTEVVLDGECLGKPGDTSHAVSMLERLSGRWHDVVTALSLQCRADDLVLSEHEVTRVKFAELSARQIMDYIARAMPFDKAGGYAIQDNGGVVDRIEGSYDNVVGLPLDSCARLLAQARLRQLSGKDR